MRKSVIICVSLTFAAWGLDKYVSRRIHVVAQPPSIQLAPFAESVLEVQGIEKWVKTLQPIGDGEVVMQDPKTKAIFTVRRIK